jgi:hypothetical protein
MKKNNKPTLRSIKQLLQVMLDNQNLFDNGLCYWVTEVYHEGLISYEERAILLKHIQNNKPSFSFIRIFVTGGYFWKAGDIKPRIKWINKHINKQ